MGLRVYKADRASKDYENDFFRDFASYLEKMFEEEELDGILLGHPYIPTKNYLKPDCVLITDHRLVIIDFKNHDGKMWLPDEASFENVPWRDSDGKIVLGGGAINPFAQLKRQKSWMEELIGFNTYGRHGVACVVCFQGDMKVMNKVPGKFQAWFSVTNSFECYNRIRDIIGIESTNRADIDSVSNYFEAKPYHDFTLVSFDKIEALSEAHEKSAEADKREFEATQKVEELEKKIKAAEQEKKAASKLKDELKVAKEKALQAKEEAEKAKSFFDFMKHELDLAKQNALTAQAEADKAKSEEKKAAIDARAAARKNKTKLLTTIIIALILLIGIGTGLWSIIDKNNRDSQKEAAEAAALEEDYKNGRKCIPVERVAEFEKSKGVCVDFYANYINDSPKYIFIDNMKNGTFALMIDKNLITEAEANSRYLNKHLEARGTIKKYNNTYEIEITDLSQITVK